MSIPLDRLYNFLHGVCNHDVIIYRFFPHGSKKLEDIKIANHKDEELSWLVKMTTPHAIFHDQEPLNFDLYSEHDIARYLENSHLSGFEYKIMAKMHLRCCIKLPFNGFDQTLLCHSEKNSKDVELYEQHDFIGVYYWSHALIARDWFRYAEVDLELKSALEHKKVDFLVYNRAWSGTREYRLLFAELIADKNLISNCNMKFSEVDGCHYTSHQFVNPLLAIGRSDLHLVYSPNKAEPTASAEYNAEDYENTALDVVLETLFDDTRLHLTEKTLRSIACGRPFILASTPGSLEYLRSYGFETFNGLIDETYDTVQDPKKRLESIVLEMQRISQLPLSTKNKLWTQLYKIASRNKERFFSKEFHNYVVQEFKDNFAQAIDRLTISGKYWNQLDLVDPNIEKNRNSDLPHRTLDELEQFKQWLILNQNTIPVV